MSNWIRVEDRLPEEREDILVCVDGKVRLGTRLDGEWVLLRKYGWTAITHWQPLPDPPKDV